MLKLIMKPSETWKKLQKNNALPVGYWVINIPKKIIKLTKKIYL